MSSIRFLLYMYVCGACRGAAVAITKPGLGKRGIEKQPFQLPDFIAATGIEKIRQAYIEKEDSKKLKQKQRERMQPKMGKMDIDYQVLHDAFFKYQTKPKLTSFGELYHEGKEFEVLPMLESIEKDSV
ncbi:uncharacterized protein LOC127073307 isoform X2 [Lathyrus oleraceus]|uniref:uncharacterized protein LOC127073307 isoform X2 n=1 Tax=Pisum sativum TaxID=3888 RepID=UPI0021D24F09|nr:uncharacterized protein LOC127073307 isoform X2 [Pisum sativum]